MSRGWVFKSGDWNFTCDSCGQKLKASKGKRRWDGFMVCKECWEPRHPQDFLKARTDKISVPWSRPQLPVIFSDVAGWTDLVKLSESGALIIVQYAVVYSDVVPVSDSFVIGKAYFLNDTVTITESMEYVITTTLTFNDAATVTESGFIYNQNYIDITYFSEDYVGEYSTF